MKITKSKLKQIISEELKALSEAEAEEDPTRIKTQTMGSTAFGAAGKEQRLGANPELSNLERGIIQQIDNFLLELAVLPGVELSTQKAAIQRVMKVLQSSVVKKQPAQPAGEQP